MREKLERKVLFIIFSLLGVGVFVAGTISIRVEKSEVFHVSKDRLMTTSKVITKSIERTMIEADPRLTMDLIDDLKAESGFMLEVYNHEGKVAFSHQGEPIEDATLMKVASSGNESIYDDEKSLVSYVPLNNLPACQKCHPSDLAVIGVVKLKVSMEKEYERIATYAKVMYLSSAIGILVVGFLLWFIMRKHIILPLKQIEEAAQKMSEGDLTFKTHVANVDEIGRLDHAIKDSLLSVSSILKRISDISKRTAMTTEMVGKESDKVVESTMIEAEAVAEISSSVEELNASISEIAESTEVLARSVQDTAASIEEMALTINSITTISHDVGEGVETTTSSIHQFSATIKEVVENAEDLAKVSDETLSAVEEITATVKEVELRAKESAALSQRVTDDAANFGMTSVKKTMEGMEKIKDSVSRTADVIHRLGLSSDEIGNILNVIDEIADQTTLLALNAAILAAQAGEHGKGFSVVANEIKDLAQRTAMSTQEIDKMIQNVRRDVSEAIDAMEDGTRAVDAGMLLTRDASGALYKILESSKKSSEMAGYIERTTTEQARTAKHVTESIERVRYMVDQIVKATSEQSKGVQLILETAEKMRGASHEAERAIEQQATGSKQITKAVESVSEMSQHISRAINEQKMGSKQIWTSIEKIKTIPEENRDLAFRINKALRDLMRDSELAKLEMERFTLFDERGSGVIGFGVVPFEAPAFLYKKFTPLVSYLSRRTGYRFDLRVASEFAGAIDDLKSGATGMCFMTSVTYIEAKEAAGARVVAKTLRNGSPMHRAAIVVRQHSNIKSLSDLAGKSFAFVDEKSASGYYVPRYMLLNEGVELSSLSNHRYLGFHEDVVKSVLSGDFDAGGVMEAVADKYKADGLKVLKYSEEMPEFNICLSNSLEKEQADAIEAALLDLTAGAPDVQEVVGSIDKSFNGLMRATDSDYEGMRRIVSRVGKRNA